MIDFNNDRVSFICRNKQEFENIQEYLFDKGYFWYHTSRALISEKVKDISIIKYTVISF